MANIFLQNTQKNIRSNQDPEESRVPIYLKNTRFVFQDPETSASVLVDGHPEMQQVSLPRKSPRVTVSQVEARWPKAAGRQRVAGHQKETFRRVCLFVFLRFEGSPFLGGLETHACFFEGCQLFFQVCKERQKEAHQFGGGPILTHTPVMLFSTIFDTPISICSIFFDDSVRQSAGSLPNRIRKDSGLCPP